jgi:chemotaxis protein MotA
VDITTIVGVLMGLFCIMLVQFLETGQVNSVMQLVQVSAAVIVIGGTMAAVITSFPLKDLKRALRQSTRVLTRGAKPLAPMVPIMVELARKSRREGLLVLEDEALNSDDRFFKQAVMALVDGTDIATLRALLENVIDQEEQFQEPGAKLWEAAGGYAPTIGILGAVMGLIHVMQNLSDPSKLGSGIAIAFVATVYGVGSANLIFLPFAHKLKMKIREESRRKEMILEAVCAIQEGLNPHHIEKRLRSFLEAHELPADAQS